MKRRSFLGMVLAITAAPAVAYKSSTLFSLDATLKPRSLHLQHLRTEESLNLVYRIGDNYQRSALRRLSYLLRDFRSGDSTAIDPRLFDLLFDVQTQLDCRGEPIQVIGGYRSPTTNRMLRRTSSGVARQSLHMTGQAVDIRIPSVSLRSLRNAAAKLGRGGVGYYPSSNFVHLDTGQPRRWSA
ncbi:YcbK family protein [Rhodoferax sp. 4810]|uniref:Murein endopeptidase K n=1 Tax=Thiospirillum jenense TaxID=1653858 RepID=A0A839HFN5_9GAMM|nr:YcbK family protein [Thiospirillum jenense]MBB1073520.1 YcbK family protein [Rhodoferax jenense]MBB1126008.1 YcbK family protein [Thiospirillum jenense]